ncbi:MAG: imm11 family protein [Pirellula sp.]|jgi:hypothetical protein
MRIWQIEDDYPDSLIAEFNRDLGFDRFMLKRGQRIEPINGRLTFRVQAGIDKIQAIDDVANSTMVPLISLRLAVALEQALGDVIQLIPASIVAIDGVVDSHKLLNVLTMVPAVDHASSRYTTVPGTSSILRFSRMVLRHDALNSVEIARSAEYSSLLLVSERLAGIIENLSPTGLQLVSAETQLSNASANNPMDRSGGSAAS